MAAGTKFHSQRPSKFPYHDRKNGNRRTLHTPFCVTANQLWTGFVLGNVEPKQLLQWWRIKVQWHANSLWHLCPLNIVNESMHSPPCMYVAVQGHIIKLMWVYKDLEFVIFLFNSFFPLLVEILIIAFLYLIIFSLLFWPFSFSSLFLICES